MRGSWKDNSNMPGNTFGLLFRITTAGESHGPGNVVIMDGVPPGLGLSVDDLLPDLQRRRPGQSKITTQRDEDDHPEILSGVFEGVTTGTSIAILIRNQDQRSKDYGDIKDKYRPGHADYTFDAKYGLRDYRGGGRSSARETTVRVAAGAVAKKMLAQFWGVRIVGYVKQVGTIIADIADPAAVTLEQVESNIVRCPDATKAEAMIELIEQVRSQRDSIGGVAELVATGVPAGWGEPVFDKLKADLGKAMFSLPAVLGVEYGNGFACATLRGSDNNDVFIPLSPRESALQSVAMGERGTRSGQVAKWPSGQVKDTPSPSCERSEHSCSPEGRGGQDTPIAQTNAESHSNHSADEAETHPMIVTRSNNHGGMLGGISSGMPIVLRCAIKPTSSIPQDQPTVTRDGQPTTISTKGRHDPCLLPRFIPMGEAMMAIVLADHALRQRALRG